MAHHLTSADKEEYEVEEHFPTGPLNDDVWIEEPVPDWHLCIHEHSQHDLCLTVAHTLGSTISHSIICTNTPEHRPQ